MWQGVDHISFESQHPAECEGLKPFGLWNLALDCQHCGGNGHIQMHQVLLLAMGMDMEGQGFARPRHTHALEG